MPTAGLPRFARSARMRSAAASVRVIACRKAILALLDALLDTTRPTHGQLSPLYGRSRPRFQGLALQAPSRRHEGIDREIDVVLPGEPAEADAQARPGKLVGNPHRPQHIGGLDL